MSQNIYKEQNKVANHNSPAILIVTLIKTTENNNFKVQNNQGELWKIRKEKNVNATFQGDHVAVFDIYWTIKEILLKNNMISLKKTTITY